MLAFAIIIGTVFAVVFFLTFLPLWRQGAAASSPAKTWVILLLGVVIPVIGIYTTIGAFPMVWLVP